MSRLANVIDRPVVKITTEPFNVSSVTQTANNGFTVVKLIDGSMLLNIEPQQVANFIVAMNRAANVWDMAPAEMKEFVDIVQGDAPLQNYYAQAGETVKGA